MFIDKKLYNSKTVALEHARIFVDDYYYSRRRQAADFIVPHNLSIRLVIHRGSKLRDQLKHIALLRGLVLLINQ